MIIDKTGKYYTNNAGNVFNGRPLTDAVELYYLYEFSDQIQVIADNPQFPSLLNYVKLGILTEEEMIQALQYK